MIFSGQIAYQCITLTELVWQSQQSSRFHTIMYMLDSILMRTLKVIYRHELNSIQASSPLIEMMLISQRRSYVIQKYDFALNFYATHGSLVIIGYNSSFRNFRTGLVHILLECSFPMCFQPDLPTCMNSTLIVFLAMTLTSFISRIIILGIS